MFTFLTQRKTESKVSSKIQPHRRIITGHDRQGRAVVERDDLIKGYVTPTRDAVLTALWATDSFPCDNSDPRDGCELISGLVTPGGSVLRIVDMLPHSRSPFHRTVSLDYGIVTSGEVWLELDYGVEVLMKAGDIVVQRGTIHAWVNKSDALCSIAFVLLDARPLVFGDHALEATPMPVK